MFLWLSQWISFRWKCIMFPQPHDIRGLLFSAFFCWNFLTPVDSPWLYSPWGTLDPNLAPTPSFLGYPGSASDRDAALSGWSSPQLVSACVVLFCHLGAIPQSIVYLDFLMFESAIGLLLLQLQPTCFRFLWMAPWNPPYLDSKMASWRQKRVASKRGNSSLQRNVSNNDLYHACDIFYKSHGQVQKIWDNLWGALPLHLRIGNLSVYLPALVSWYLLYW